MGRNNADFHNQILYHGSPHPFQPGDIINPRNPKLGASATDDFEMAESYGKSRYLPLPHLVEKGYKPRVFQVEPVSTVTNSGKFGGKEFNDKKGFRVIKEVQSPSG